MNIIIESTLKTLEKTKSLLNNIDDTTLSDNTVGPYYSSIGSHVRHILDFYDCIFKIDSDNRIDLTARNRQLNVESRCDCAQDYLNDILTKLTSFQYQSEKIVFILDDLGMGKTEIPYTLGSLFSQANSHTIHHYAIISYILSGLNINLKDVSFGYNPTTPVK